MFIWQTDQGIKCLGVDKAGELAGSDPDYGIKDLYEAIATNNFVSKYTQHKQFAHTHPLPASSVGYGMWLC